MFTAPLIGSFFDALGGFRHTCEAVSMVVIIFAWVQSCIFSVEQEYNIQIQSPRPRLHGPVGMLSSDQINLASDSNEENARLLPENENADPASQLLFCD